MNKIKTVKKLNYKELVKIAGKGLDQIGAIGMYNALKKR